MMMWNMKKALFVLLFFVIGHVSLSHADEVVLHGAGATFPYPIYAQWIFRYHQLTGQKINYQSLGSGQGISQVQSNTIDFGATDTPLNEKDLKKYNLLQFPTVVGGVVPVVNLPGLKGKKLKITSEILSGIYLGKITSWNHLVLRKLNPHVQLPDKKIMVVHRADSSGTTWLFTRYLSEVSELWKEQVGFGKSVAWPIGVGAIGNAGVASFVKRIDGSIGFVEYAHALQGELQTILLKNQSGRFVEPSLQSFTQALKQLEANPDRLFQAPLINLPGSRTWPITGASYVLISKKKENVEKVNKILSFFDWAFVNGQEIANDLHYVILSKKWISLLRERWSKDYSILIP